MKHQAGYTLLELLVVLVIMGLLISAIPGIAFPGIEAFRFSGKMQEIASRLSAAHESAIETGQTVVVR
jgi:prepilin-type N-terminal cleavage/methylation domain-containing protein